jgi:hypothetical protein
MAWTRMTASTVLLFQLIPFACGQDILRLVSPVLLDDRYNALDTVVRFLAPLLLP